MWWLLIWLLLTPDPSNRESWQWAIIGVEETQQECEALRHSRLDFPWTVCVKFDGPRRVSRAAVIAQAGGGPPPHTNPVCNPGRSKHGDCPELHTLPLLGVGW